MTAWQWAFVTVASFLVLVVCAELWLRRQDRQRQVDDEKRRQALEFAATHPSAFRQSTKNGRPLL
jgi:hypothetical protein